MLVHSEFQQGNLKTRDLYYADLFSQCALLQDRFKEQREFYISIMSCDNVYSYSGRKNVCC
jgi:hypothetical protein